MTQAIRREMQRAVPYHLATEFYTLGANATVTLTAQVPGDADFEARYINASVTSVLASLVIRDSGTRLEAMNRPCIISLVSGIGQQPYVLPQPALFVRNSNVEFVLVDLSGDTNKIQVVLCGFLLYPAAQPIG